MTTKTDVDGGGIDATEAAPKIRTLLVGVLALLIVGVLGSVLAISFAAVMFSGPLEVHLGKGVALTLIAGCVLGLAGTFASSLKGAVLGPQDLPAIILALGSATIAGAWTASPDADLYATVAMLIAVSTIAIGATLFVLGRFRLGAFVRYLPYPVMGGFMAATGWFLLLGAIGMMSGRQGFSAIAGIFVTGADALSWAPGLIVGAALFIAARVVKSWAAMPVVIGGAFIAFYGALFATGVSLEEAGRAGLLLGPFPEAEMGDALPILSAGRADWSAIAAQTPFVLAAIAIAVVGMLLNLTGAELALGEPVNVDTDLKRTGLANLAAGALGGAAGYTYISLTILARRLGAPTGLAGASVGVACGAALAFDSSLIGALPVSVFGGLIAYLGMDLLYQWLWEERRRLPPLDYGIILSILIVAAGIGFLEGIAVGVAASVAVFVYTCVTAPVIRRSFSNDVRFSMVERPAGDAALLERHGGETRAYEVQGQLFFGTISKLSDRVVADLDAAGSGIRRVLIDLSRAQDLDTSAIYGIAKLVADCGRRRVDLAISGLETGLIPRLIEVLPASNRRTPEFFRDLDKALEWAEEETLSGHERLADDHGHAGPRLFGRDTEGAEQAMDAYFTAEDLAAGDHLIRVGETDNDIFFLAKGVLVIEIAFPDGTRLRVGTHYSGTVIGEMALYTGAARSADVVALTDCEVLRLSEDALERMERDEPALALRFHRSAAMQLSNRLRRTNGLVGVLKA